MSIPSFLAFQKARDARQRAALWWALSVISFVFALLVKEVSVVLPAIFLVDAWVDSQNLFTGKNKFRVTTTVLALYGGVAAAWLAWRHHILGQIATTHSSIGWGASLLTAPKIVLFQFFRVLGPVGLSPHYDFQRCRFLSKSLGNLSKRRRLSLCIGIGPRTACATAGGAGGISHGIAPACISDRRPQSH